MTDTVTITTTAGDRSSDSGAGSGAGNASGTGGIFIVDGVITTTATPNQRNAARTQRFPGTGHCLGDTESLSPKMVTATAGDGGDPPPPPPPGSTVTARLPPHPSSHVVIRPSPGPGQRLEGRDLMNGNINEWDMTRSASMADIYLNRLSRIAIRGPALIAEFQAALGEFIAAQKRQAQRPRPSVDPCNPCGQHSLLPSLTPVEIRTLERVLPKPPLPCGYWRGIFDHAGVLEAFNSENIDNVLRVVQNIAAALRSRHLESTMIDQLAKSMEWNIEWLRKNLEKNVVTGCFNENEELLQNAIAYFGTMCSNQQSIFKKARDKIRDYEAAKVQFSLFQGELSEIGAAHRCLNALIIEARSLCELLKLYFGEAFLQNFPKLAPLMIRLRLLRQIFERTGGPQKRVLKVHSECLVTLDFLQLCRNRFAAPGDGRCNPNWKNTRFEPLHFHIHGYSQSLIYSWLGTKCLFVHGTVPFHMDAAMCAKDAAYAKGIEDRREDEESFVEYLVFPDQIISIQQLLAMTIDNLQELLRKL